MSDEIKKAIAMLIYDDQMAWIEGRAIEPSGDLKTIEGCNFIADKIIDLIFS